MSEEKKVRVYLAMPWCGSIVPQAAWAGFVAAARDYPDLAVTHPCRSLLAYNNNHTWCEFVNDEAPAGGPFDYFCLLHSDVAPVAGAGWDCGWLSLMVRLSEAHDLGVLHAVCNIKDDRRITSTAVGPSDDAFYPVRKLTLKEVHRLPPTFVHADVCKALGTPAEWCLLPNTGCLLISRARFPVDDFPGFTILDRLDWAADPATGRRVRVPQVAPEDWNLGRWCAGNGVRVGGTREVVTRHFGTKEYRSDDASEGGWDVDNHHFRAMRQVAEGMRYRGELHS